MSTLDDWTEALCAEFGLDQAEAPGRTMTYLASAASHTVDGLLLR